jgi:calreticulin
MKIALVFAALVAVSFATIYFEETFSDDAWESRWVSSKSREAEGSQGKWAVSAGKFYNDAKEDQGLQTTQDARFYQISAEFPKFSNKDKDLILQYSVKHEQKIDCGGGYVKILPGPVDQAAFNGDTPYNIMFGPDICGYSTKKVHVIFNYKGQNYLIKKDIPCETDEFTHLYTLVVSPDNTYRVLIDEKEVAKGNLAEDWDFLPPKEIKDPAQSKPADWVDEKTIADPEDKKPEGWDDIPKEIADPDATKPEDWDDELDGEWEAPSIDNPDYKGEWKARQIPNPDYKGEWVHPVIPNPAYAEDSNLYLYENNQFVGFELWQVKAGTIFDNILITDNWTEAEAFAARTRVTKEGEKKAFDKAEEERKAKEEEERKVAEAAAATEEQDHEGHDHEHDEL